MTEGHLHPEPEYFRQTEHPLLDDGEGAYGRTAAIAPAPPVYDRHEGKTAAEWAELADSRYAIIQNQAETIRGYMQAVRDRDNQLDVERAKERRTNTMLTNSNLEVSRLREHLALVTRSNDLRMSRITRLRGQLRAAEQAIDAFLHAVQDAPAGSFGQRTALQRAVALATRNKGQTVQRIEQATGSVATLEEYRPMEAP